MVRSSLSTSSIGLGAGRRFASSTRRNSAWTGSPLALCCFQPVRSSATGFRYSTQPSISVVITPSPIEASVTWASSFSANSSAAASCLSVMSVSAPAIRTGLSAASRTDWPRTRNQRYSSDRVSSLISTSNGEARVKWASSAVVKATASSGMQPGRHRGQRVFHLVVGIPEQLLEAWRVVPMVGDDVPVPETIVAAAHGELEALLAHLERTLEPHAVAEHPLRQVDADRDQHAGSGRE